MERRWGSDLTVFVAPPTDSSWSRAVVAALVEQRLTLVPEVQHGVESTGARTACNPAARSRASHWAASACRHLQRVVVQNPQPACAAEADRAEATVAPLRDLHGRGERFEEVKMERRVAPGEGTVASLPSGRSPANAVTRSSWFRWRPYS